ncbi:hypothetical protein BH23ACT9_BH23ACT9_19360 [soil metagenome]
MYVGPSRTGVLLEIGVLDVHTAEALIIHAMPARPAYLRRL